MKRNLIEINLKVLESLNGVIEVARYSYGPNYYDINWLEQSIYYAKLSRRILKELANKKSVSILVVSTDTDCIEYTVDIENKTLEIRVPNYCISNGISDIILVLDTTINTFYSYLRYARETKKL